MIFYSSTALITEFALIETNSTNSTTRMWVVDYQSTMVLPMEETQITCRHRLPSTPSSGMGTKILAHAMERPVVESPQPCKRRRSEMDLNGTCMPSQLHCRYANKPCMNPRAVKRTGGLHTFCALHRANANRNQRRLDLRKRLQKQQAVQAAQAQKTEEQMVKDTKTTPSVTLELAPIQVPVVDVEALYEPLLTPTPLEDEDVSTLFALFVTEYAN